MRIQRFGKVGKGDMCVRNMCLCGECNIVHCFIAKMTVLNHENYFFAPNVFTPIGQSATTSIGVMEALSIMILFPGYFPIMLLFHHFFATNNHHLSARARGSKRFGWIICASL